MNRRRRVIAVVLAFFLLVPVLWVIGPRLWLAYRLRSAERAWARTSEPIGELLAAHPRTAENAEGRRLGELCRGLDISIASAQSQDHHKQTPALNALMGWVGEQGVKTAEGPDPPPAEVARYLSDHRAEIEAIESHILASGPILWDSDLAAGNDAPSPPLYGHRYLHSVLLAHALEAAGRGDAPGSNKALEASWRVSQSLERRPQVIPELIRVMVSDLQQGALRRLPDPSRAWRERLANDHRRRMLRALHLESWSFTSYLQGMGLQDLEDRENGQPRRTGWSAGTQRMLTRPFMELMTADFAHRVQTHAAAVGAMDACRLDPEAYDTRVEASIPFWNFMGRIGMPNTAKTWMILGTSGFDAELTRLVLEAKARRADGLPFVLEPRRSEACPSVRWVATAGEGGVTIAPESDPFPASSPYKRTRRFTVAGPAAR